MYVTIPALLLAALLPTAPADPQPRCRAELQGTQLTTRIGFPDGYSVEAPWKVVQTQQAWLTEGRVFVTDLSLDRIIEEDGITGERTTTPLLQPVTVTVEGATRPEIVREAAEAWCSTVLRARAASGGSRQQALPLAGRMT